MTEDWVARELVVDGAEVPQTDLDTVVALGRSARRRRRRFQGGGAVLVAAVVLVGGVAVAGAVSRPHPAAIGPADQPGTTASASADPATLAECAGADTAAAAAVSRDVEALLSSDYRNPGAGDMSFATGDLSDELRQQLPALTRALVAAQSVTTAQVEQIGYVGGGCDHPRYLVAVGSTLTQPQQASPKLFLTVYTVSALPVDGIYKLDSLEPLAAMPPTAAPTP